MKYSSGLFLEHEAKCQLVLCLSLFFERHFVSLITSSLCEVEIAELEEKHPSSSQSVIMIANGSKFRFAMAFTGLSVLAFAGALDATILPCAMPVSPIQLVLLAIETSILQ